MDSLPILDLVIIGAQKSFTTSLKTYLGEHPSVITHPQQELAYFTDDKEYKMGYQRALAHYYKNIDYNAHKKMVAKSAFLYISERSIKRLYDHNPNCKLVLSLRNPVDRAYSAYLMECNYADMEFPFNEIKSVVEKADDSYWPFKLFIDAGNYAKHLQSIYKYFPKDQVKVVLCEEIKEDAIKVCKDIFEWLGVDDTFVPDIKVYNPTMKRGSKLYAKLAHVLLKQSPILRKSAGLIMPSYYNYKIGNFIRRANKTKQRYEPMDAITRGYLLGYYRESNKELEEMIGKKVTVLWSK